MHVQLSAIAASAALCVSDIPWHGPSATVRVGMIDGQFVLNPTAAQSSQSSLNLLYTGVDDKVVRESDTALACLQRVTCRCRDARWQIMLEAGGVDVRERDMIAALRFANESVSGATAAPALWLRCRCG